MPDNSSNNKRIAKNTLALYVRMGMQMLIGLFTSRVVLATLGVSDYGIYNVVGGFVALFSMLSGSMSVAVSRYITFELGRGGGERLRRTFATSMTIQCIVAVGIALIAEVVSIWFLENKMVLPAERLGAAHWVLQCSIAAFVVGLVYVPFNAAIIAHERMSAFAYISIFDTVMKLAVVYVLYVSPADKLATYAVLLLIVSIITCGIYIRYCLRHFAECHFRWGIDKSMLRGMLSFIGWAFWGNGVVVLKDQGANVLLNLFCGPAVNAARGVAMQVNNVVYQFVSNFLTAVTPQITKSFSGGDLGYMHNIIIKAGKLSFLILLLLFFPLCANIDYVLGVWLVEVPAHTAAFIVLILLYSLLDCFGNPLVHGVLAEGNIKRYEIVLTVLYLSNFLASWLALAMGCVPEWVFVLNVVFKVFVVGALLWHSHARYGFPIRRFLRQSALRSAAVFAVCAVFAWCVCLADRDSLFGVLWSSALIASFTALAIYTIGLNKREANYVVGICTARIKRIAHK